jgi:hypothetical protein
MRKEKARLAKIAKDSPPLGPSISPPRLLTLLSEGPRMVPKSRKRLVFVAGDWRHKNELPPGHDSFGELGGQKSKGVSQCQQALRIKPVPPQTALFDRQGISVFRHAQNGEAYQLDNSN